jgi:ribosomal protein S18 acetylase RimI-like enzyme
MGARTLGRARITHADARLHEAFLRYVPRVFPRADFRAWYVRGGWTDDYEAHVLAEGDEVVANVSVMRMRLVVDGCEVRGAQLGAVGSVPEWRGRGLMRPLLERVLEGLEREAELVLLYANEGVLDFYPRFGFRRARESLFELAVSLDPAASPAPRVDLDDPAQRAAWLRACARSPPPTERFGARAYGSAALWHACAFYRQDVHVLAEGEAYAVAVQRGDTLELLDVAAPRPFELLPALPRVLRRPIARIRFGFCPERWCPGATAVGESDDLLFVRGGPSLPAAPFKLPALAQT